MNRKVLYAKFHQELFFPGTVGSLGSTLPSTIKSLPDLSMTWDTDLGGLVISLLNKEYLVPSANVVAVALAPKAKNEKNS